MSDTIQPVNGQSAPGTVERVKHTQGPWEVDSGMTPNARSVVARTCNGTPISANTNGPHDRRENRANARLIAAAPEAVQEIQNQLDDWRDLYRLVQAGQFDAAEDWCKANADEVLDRGYRVLAKATLPE